jgi:DHA1 family multidrug resistance protein-like MFS transporter
MAQAIGVVQTGHRLGPAIGPVIGGVLALLVGLRNVFLVASACYVIALLNIVLFYDEPREGKAPRRIRGGREVFLHLVRLPGFLLALGVIFGLQTVDRSFGPVLPLYVAQLGVVGPRVPIVTGILFSLGALSTALGHHLAGKLAPITPARTVVTWGALIAAMAVSAIILAPTLWLVGIAMVVFGVALGISTTTIYAVAGALLPADAHATGFGFMTTASLIGLAVSPVVSGFIGGAGLRIVFVVDVVLLVILAAFVAARMAGANRLRQGDGGQEAPALHDIQEEITP